jgi:tetratricopeptide (TPR) repeat protein
MAKPVFRRPILQDPEEVLNWAQRLVEPLKRYKKWIFLGLAAVLIIAATWGMSSWIQAGREEKAALALAQLQAKLGAPEAEAATVKSLEAITRDYPGTRAARGAQVWRAHLLYQMQKYAEAARAYEAIPAGRDPGWDALVAESLSYCFEAQGDLKKAAQVLKPLAETTSGAFQGEIWRRLALLLEAAGDRQDAAVYWQKLLDHPSNPALLPYFKEKVATAGTGEKKN